MDVIRAETFRRRKGPDVIKTTRLPVKPMSVEEAVMQMDLMSNEFFVFRNADTDTLSRRVPAQGRQLRPDRARAVLTFAPRGRLGYTRTQPTMKITEILAPEAILPDMRATSKAEALEELAGVVAKRHPGIDRERLVEVLHEREELGSTAIGEGIAIPHGKLHGIGDVVAVFGRSMKGVEFDSLDGGPTRLFFLLVAPDDSAGVHLKALARISRLLKDRDFRARLFESQDPDALYAAIREEDAKY